MKDKGLFIALKYGAVAALGASSSYAFFQGKYMTRNQALKSAEEVLQQKRGAYRVLDEQLREGTIRLQMDNLQLQRQQDILHSNPRYIEEMATRRLERKSEIIKQYQREQALKDLRRND